VGQTRTAQSAQRPRGCTNAARPDCAVAAVGAALGLSATTVTRTATLQHCNPSVPAQQPRLITPSPPLRPFSCSSTCCPRLAACSSLTHCFWLHPTPPPPPTQQTEPARPPSCGLRKLPFTSHCCLPLVSLRIHLHVPRISCLHKFCLSFSIHTATPLSPTAFNRTPVSPYRISTKSHSLHLSTSSTCLPRRTMAVT
jgi:hypothetical protein